jgi:hypothetical protein
MSYVIPNTTTELLGFYGNPTPVSQPTAAAQAAVTDSSGGSAAPTTGVVANAYKHVYVISLDTMSTLANSQVYKLAIPHAFTVLSVTFRATNPITTGGKAATLTGQVNGAAMTGGVISVSGAYATGATQASTAVTAGNTGTAGQTVEVAVSAVTTFIEGSGVVEVAVTNTNLANAAATQIAQANAIRSALVSLALIKGS